MHSVGNDLLVMWVAAVVLIFMFLFFGALTVGGKERIITGCIIPAIVLIGAIFVTIGQLVGFIGVW